jgi:hypothetical protein
MVALVVSIQRLMAIVVAPEAVVEVGLAAETLLAELELLVKAKTDQVV